MIEISMTSPEGVTLATAGKYCPENVKVTPGFDFAANAKRWDITIASDTADTNQVLLTDPWLAEHQADQNLIVFLYAKFTIEPRDEDTKGAWAAAYASNMAFLNLADTETVCYGVSLRKANGSNTYGTGFSWEPLTITSAPSGGQVRVSVSGELTLVRTASYPLRAGEYGVMAWLM